MVQISVVVPAHNASRFLAQTVESVLAQTITDWELIVVDDGSTDDTPAVAKAYAERDSRILLLRQTNGGVAAARNRGLAACDRCRDYVIFLDADDVWEKDALEVLAGTLDATPEAVAASGLSRYINADGQPCDPGELEIWGRHRLGVAGKRLAAWPVDAPTTLEVLAYQNYISTPGQVLVRRAVLGATGGFDPACTPCEDRDMWIRLAQRGDIAFTDRVVLSKRVHPQNASRHKELMLQKQRYVRRKLLSSPTLHAEQRRVVLAAHRLWGLQVCSTRLRWARQLVLQGEPVRAVKQVRLALANCMDASHGLPVEGAVLRPSLKQLYRSALAAPSGIKQHLGILLRLARRSDHVTEFGTLGGVSTSILLAAQPKLLISYDLEKHPLIVALEYAARELRGTRFVFQQQDALEVEIGETDMLLIDAWHTYDLLRRGLALHSSKVRKYLALLHATTPGEVGEAGNTSPPRQAIEEFLPQNPEWSLSVLGAHNNGLTILTRSRGTCPTRRSSRW